MSGLFDDTTILDGPDGPYRPIDAVLARQWRELRPVLDPEWPGLSARACLDRVLSDLPAHGMLSEVFAHLLYAGDLENLRAAWKIPGEGRGRYRASLVRELEDHLATLRGRRMQIDGDELRFEADETREPARWRVLVASRTRADRPIIARS